MKNAFQKILIFLLIPAMIAYAAQSEYKMNILGLIPNSLPATGNNGQVVYNSADNQLYYYHNGWVVVGSGGGGGGGGEGFVGKIVYPAINTCLWASISTTFADFPAQTGCNTPAVTGTNAIAPATKIPAIKITTLDPGDYLIIAQGGMQMDAVGNGGFKISDGSTLSGSTYVGGGPSNQLVGQFSYTTPQTNIQFSVQAATNNVSNMIDITDRGFPDPDEFSIVVISLNGGAGAAPVAFRAMGTPTAATFTAVNPAIFSTLGTYGFDSDSAYNTTTGIYTIPKAGTYQSTCNLAIAGTYSSTGSSNVYILQNGNNLAYNKAVPAGPAGAATPSATVIFQAAMGDTIQCNPESDATSPAFVAVDYYNWFEVHEVSSSTGSAQSGGQNVVTVTTNGSISPTVTVVLCNATGGNVTQTLPSIGSSINKKFDFKKIDSSANTCTFKGAGSDTIDGQNTFVLTGQYDSVTAVNGGSEWNIL